MATAACLDHDPLDQLSEPDRRPGALQQDHHDGPERAVAQNWNAILTFKYTTAPEHEKDRVINPLGFQVVNYRSDPEA
jgi:hypothetical protein